MARTAITAQTPKGPYPGTISANLLDITATAGDAGNGNSVAWVGNRMLLTARNSGAGARTITLTSVADARTARSGTITAFSMGAGEYMQFIFERDGWQQSDGALYIDCEHAEVLLIVSAIP